MRGMSIRPATAVGPLLAIAAALCGGACGPSLDPAAKADIDRRLATMPATAQTVAPPRSFLPMPFAVGQWTQHRMTDDKGNPGFLTYKLVGRDDNGWWIETVTEQYTGRHVMKMLVVLQSGRDPAGMEVRALKMKDSKGRVTEMDASMLSLMRSLYQGSLQMLQMGWEGKPQETMTVPAGTFSACYKVQTEATWGPWHATSLSWSHPAVPLSGLVRSQRLDKPGIMELVNYGETGAQSEL
jgi:hypothetical protein